MASSKIEVDPVVNIPAIENLFFQLQLVHRATLSARFADPWSAARK
jgi:hypothetical protein